MAIRSLLFMVVLVLVMPRSALADCPDALSDFDFAVCQAQNFNWADAQLNQSYDQLYQTLMPDEQAQLRHEELAWIRRRNADCAMDSNDRVFIDFDCAARMTQQRSLALSERLEAPAAPAVYNGQYVVLGSAEPWVWQPFGLNSAYAFGAHDGTSPTVLLLSGLKARPGQSLVIRYVSGQANLGPAYAFTDANGIAGTQWGDAGGNGSTGAPFPSAFMSPYPIHPGALVGGFADNTGQLVEPPFALGDGPTRERIPPGATRLQLGINDDRLADNAGSFVVAVTVAP